MAEPTYLSGERIQGRSDDTLPITVPTTGWKELDSEKLGSDGSTITVSNFAAKDNLMVLMHLNSASGSLDSFMTFDGDTDDVYAFRRNEQQGTDTTHPTQANIEVGNGLTDNNFAVMTIRNIPKASSTGNKQKIGIYHFVEQGGTGASTPLDVSGVFKWVDPTTDNQITTLTMTATGNNFESGSEVVVLGCDDDESISGTNFWEELTDKTISSSGELRTDSFTGKEYLWIQAQTKVGSSTASWGFNDDISSSNGNYGSRGYNNGADANGSYNSNNADTIFMGNADHTTWEYLDSYFVNKSNKVKLGRMFKTYGAAGASTPSRIEQVANWDKTDQQITRIRISQPSVSSLNCDAGSSIRVWGGTPT